MKIFCFGDSITWGAWDTEGGWPVRLRRSVEERDRSLDPNPCNMLYNCGVSSDTSKTMLARFKPEVDARLLEGMDGEPIFICCIGTNDCIKDTNTGNFWVEPDEYKATIKELINTARLYSNKIVFLGNMGVDESKTHAYSWDTDSETFNSDIEAYEKLTSEVCVAEGVGFIEVFSLHAGEEVKKYLSDDGLHENNEGHELLTNLAWDYISRSWL